jgi:hypothetical protein
VVHLGEKINTQKVLVGNLKQRDDIEFPGVGGKIISE